MILFKKELPNSFLEGSSHLTCVSAAWRVGQLLVLSLRFVKILIDVQCHLSVSHVVLVAGEIRIEILFMCSLAIHVVVFH